VLQSLLRSEGLSRADLAVVTKLTPATISQLVGILIEDGLVEELGLGPVKVGRPATLVGIKADARFVVCADLSDASVFRAAVVDLKGGIGQRVEVSLGDAVGEEAVGLVEEIVADSISAAPGALLGIGVGTPGVVTADGVVLEADNLRWFDIGLAERLSRRFGLPVSVANDANTAALAEYAYAATTQNLMVVRVGGGVGAGTILNGQQHRGESQAAGEIGHVVVDVNGPPCRCGNRGCLETFVSVSRIEAALAVGDMTAVQAAGRHLGAVLATAVSILDIHDVVLAGADSQWHEDLCRIALAELRSRTLSRLSEAVTIRVSGLGDDVVLLGANVLVLSQELGVA
jgi:predicted NBD/HSP70 family sugar kinase